MIISKHIFSNLDKKLITYYSTKRYYHSTNRLLGPKQINISEDVEKLRNMGIIAHINAGKTTTTERILYNAGSTDTVGDVDKGNTVTDYLEQERDRGITITSAAVTYQWKKHRVNLIDTPGHVDFTYEVERSLSVLDGVVTILDSSAGVEAQTITVWNQAKKYRLPNIIYLNKYDKPQANYKMCMKDLKQALDIRTCLIQLPIKTNNDSKKFTSILDVINRNCFSWSQPELDQGSKFDTESIKDKKQLELIEMLREDLVNKLSDLDDDLASHVLDCDKISDVSSELLVQALRRATLNCSISPVLAGSSFKYIGVQQLMNAIVDYLPSPLDREKQLKSLLQVKRPKSSNVHGTCAFNFKIMHDNRLGALSYLKILNGSLKSLQKIRNIENPTNLEQVKKVYRVFADELKEINDPILKHDIVVVTGLTESRTGDILVDQNFTGLIQAANNNSEESHEDPIPYKLISDEILIPQINRLEPVYFCSIESRNNSEQLKLEHALARLAREDPSFSYDIDQLGITTIRGMGKLHLEIIRDRIETEYKIRPILGPLQISYRETIEGYATEETSISKLINGVQNTLSIKLYLKSKPKSGKWTRQKLRLDMSTDSNLGKLRMDHRKAIENGFMSALAHGPLIGFPMIDCDILLLGFEANRRCSLPVISSAASQCLTAAIKRCSPLLLEPIMLLEVVCPSEFNGTILTNLTGVRRSIIDSTLAKPNGTIVIRSQTPLSVLSDYSEFLRINTSGRGSFSMELYSYNVVGEHDRLNIIRV